MKIRSSKFTKMKIMSMFHTTFSPHNILLTSYPIQIFTAPRETINCDNIKFINHFPCSVIKEKKSKHLLPL